MHAQLPRIGDVLVSRPTATVTLDISILPEDPAIVCRNHDQAVAEGRRLAEQHKVDAWLTVDHRHFLRIGSFRTDGSRD